MAKGRAVSRDPTDAYSCSDTSEIQKIPSVRLQTSGFSVHGLTLRNAPKPVKFSQINEYNNSRVTTLCCISIPIPKKLANKRSVFQSAYLQYKFREGYIVRAPR